TYTNYHLLLIDDGSRDGTADMVSAAIPNLTVLRGSGNWWWAGSLHQGYLWLRKTGVSPGEMVLIINDDSEFAEDFLELATAWLENHSRTMLLAQAYSRTTGKLRDAGVHADWRRFRFEPLPPPEQINCLSTRGLFFRVGDFLQVGGFYPRLLPHYGSDYEFTMRARRRGLKLATDPAVRLWMDEDATGNHSLKGLPVITYMRKLFSRKTPANPIFFSIFIALSCPVPYVPLNWLRVWAGAAGGMIARVAGR
ncbi:MAG TPA: glycosyltransferase, partial [Desulfobaccales bacterium]